MSSNSLGLQNAASIVAKAAAASGFMAFGWASLLPDPKDLEQRLASLESSLQAQNEVDLPPSSANDGQNTSNLVIQKRMMSEGLAALIAKMKATEMALDKMPNGMASAAIAVASFTALSVIAGLALAWATGRVSSILRGSDLTGLALYSAVGTLLAALVMNVWAIDSLPGGDINKALSATEDTLEDSLKRDALLAAVSIMAGYNVLAVLAGSKGWDALSSMMSSSK